MSDFAANSSWRSTTCQLARNSVPIALFYVVEMAMGFIDTAVAGRLGTVELGAVGLATGLMFAFLYAAFGMTSTTAIFVADGHGQARADSVKSSFVAGLLVAALLSPLIIVIAISIPEFMRLTGQDGAVVTSASLYLHGAAASVPLALVFNVYRSLLSAVGSGAVVVWASVIGIVVNLVASPVLAFGTGWSPALGVFGIGLGTTIAHATMVLVVVAATWKLHRIAPLGSWRTQLNTSLIYEFLAIGWPGLVLGLFESGFFAAMQVVAGMYGVASLSATTVGIQLADIISVIGLSIGEATMISVAASNSRTPDTRAANSIIVTGSAIAALLMIAACLGVTFNPGIAEIVFLGESENSSVAFREHLLIVLAILPLALAADAVQLVLVRGLKALRDTRGPMVVAAVGYWIVGIGGGYLLATVGQLGMEGIWIGFAAGLTFVSVVLTFRLFLRKPIS
ncbi:MATE family efflux transporter [Agrobacterium tumefaciens]|uniref:MATE family efflux transporter n=1 Tax=Agrobacterium tumefaciens TaxID=358 RepID=UPI0015746863|nr:MATE family efflux transporter [Agrobacterium tumefaciens]WCJ66291.1 MATE family efflux transporter [Agrobacterium tumefaciens]